MKKKKISPTILILKLLVSYIYLITLTQETTPLAGSSAGAIVCAVIASGASMQEALQATKLLAADCRLRGTAFRLGVNFYCKI